LGEERRCCILPLNQCVAIDIGQIGHGFRNTVGVGAVRDLYGTVLNEGATKGVLVTTSDYGPDSYAFANGKPLVLLSGANLLHMLEKHGHRARIDLQEAKKLAANP